MQSTETIAYIWLEVANLAFSQNEQMIEVQLKGDHEVDRWLQFKNKTDANLKSLVDAMKEKRPIHAKLAAEGKDDLRVHDLRVTFGASSGRS